MSRGERLTVIGLYLFNNRLFEDMKYPAGFSADDKQTVIGNIMSECAELEILFPDYDVCKAMIALWSKMNYPTWNRIYQASKLEYNPIENYNRTETETITNDLTDTHSGTDTRNSTTQDNQISEGNNSRLNSGTDTSMNYITTYDNNTPQLHDKTDLTHGLQTVDTFGSVVGNERKENGSETHQDTISKEGTVTRENHTSGNIGVTTSQQMLDQEIEISAKLNIIKIIVDSFKERFCLLVY